MTLHVTTSSDYIYDVFLSLWDGTRYGFTDHLYQALLDKGINTFRVDHNLRIGEDISPDDILEKIEKSRMSIVVLCENYATSTWCLDQIAKIMDCYDNKGKPVSAIFYKVEPTNVRYQKESYKTAMDQHEEDYGKDSEKVRAWRLALKRVCDLSGGHLKDNAYEFELIKKIVKDTSTRLPPVPLEIKSLVGLDSRFEQVKPLLDIESNNTVRMLGIYGDSGIGKTTFVADLYNKIKHQFKAACFLASVREKSNTNPINGLEELQKTLLYELGEDTKTMVVSSTFKGSSEIKRKLGRKRVLLGLDDVDKIDQLKALAGRCDWFGAGSRIIITTRDASLLDKHDVEIKKYKMEGLNDPDSLELFCWYAFNMSQPAENFEDISSRVVSYAKGSPSALKLIGSNLKGLSVEECDMELDKYEQKVPSAKTQGVLEISYNSLSELEEENEVFINSLNMVELIIPIP